LDTRVAVLDISDSGGDDGEEDLAAVVLVADGYKIYIIDGSGNDAAGERRKGAKNVL
jgi:hypothetical protein